MPSFTLTNYVCIFCCSPMQDGILMLLRVEFCIQLLAACLNLSEEDLHSYGSGIRNMCSFAIGVSIQTCAPGIYM